MTFAPMMKKLVALAAVLATALPAQAALVLEADKLNDTTSGLAWRGFQTAAEGQAAGFRIATGTEFGQLLVNGGFELKLKETQAVVPTWSEDDLATRQDLQDILAGPQVR